MGALAIPPALKYDPGAQNVGLFSINDIWLALTGVSGTFKDAYMPEQLLTLEQVAEYLNVDKFTVYRLLADKDLPAFKVGNQWRFKRRLIENWLTKNSNANRKYAPQDQ